MNKLNIQLENCFGIGQMDEQFDFAKRGLFIIYAPNGIMKSSFSKTFELISINENDKISDRVFPSRITKYKISFDDNQDLINENILVFNGDDGDFDASKKINNFIASVKLKKKYDSIYNELSTLKMELFKKLKLLSQSTDCEEELLNTFSSNNVTSIFEIFITINEQLKNKVNKYDFKYNDVFDKKGNVKKFLDKHKDLIQVYFNNYQNILSKSNFFKKSNNSFGTIQANDIIKSIQDNSFFEAGHKILLEGNREINSVEILKSIIEDEISKIINNKELKDTFKLIDKAIGSNQELKSFKKVIENNNLLLIDLENYNDFKKIVWLGYLSEIKNDISIIIKDYSDKKNELEQILYEAKKEIELWHEIIDDFNNRFHVPFKVKLTNIEDVILKKDTAVLSFEYNDTLNYQPEKQDKESLLKVLSKGEQRAFFILQLLFEIKSRIQQTGINLLILDDISDSFDYKNKFAIIEYIQEWSYLDKFRILILTHNFDFYRTLNFRLNLPNENILIAIKDINRKITLKNGSSMIHIFKELTLKPDIEKNFVSLIPFVRNIIEYSEGNKDPNYLLLTECLHIKKNSYSITSNQILEIFQSKISNCKNKNISFSEKSVISLILETAKSIIEQDEIDEIDIINKFVLSIAIRLQSEIFMINNLDVNEVKIIKRNQTFKLLEKYKQKFGNNTQTRILSKVVLMTSENIHINSFMFEPLIDMSVNHLTKLYKEVFSLEIN